MWCALKMKPASVRQSSPANGLTVQSFTSAGPHAGASRRRSRAAPPDHGGMVDRGTQINLPREGGATGLKLLRSERNTATPLPPRWWGAIMTRFVCVTGATAWTACVLLAALGCQEIDGECWPVSEDGQGAGVGAGGPVGPGSGAYGASAEPQNADDDEPPPGCDVGSQVFDVEACKRRCDRKAAAGHKKCNQVPPGPERGKCRQVVEEQRGYCYGDCERRRDD